MAATLTVPCWPFHFAVIPIASSDKFVCRASDSYRQRSMCTLLPSTRTVVYMQFAQCPLRMSCLWPRCSQALIVPLSVRLLPQWLACRWRHFGVSLALCPCACDHILKVCNLTHYLTNHLSDYVEFTTCVQFRAEMNWLDAEVKRPKVKVTMRPRMVQKGILVILQFMHSNVTIRDKLCGEGIRLAVEDHLDYYYSYASRSVHTLLSGFNC